MRSQQEHNEQTGFFQWTELHEKYHPGLSRFFAVPNGGERVAKVDAKGRRFSLEGKRLKAAGLRPGIPDVFNLTQGEGTENEQPYEYRGLIFEFKSDTGRLSPEQKDWCEYFREQGFRVEVPRSWVEAALITIEYFGLPEELKKNLPLHRVKGAA